MNRDQALKAFGSVLEKLDPSKGIADNFRNFLDFTLWMLNPNKTEELYKEVEHIDKSYNAEKSAKYMSELFELWSIASDNDGAGFYDALGDLFMENISHGKLGQFFTTQPICDMMAELIHGNNIKENANVLDPACGSGRMLLSIAKIQRKAKFYAADVDATCCKMTVLNMIVNSMPGEVAWMNTLSNEHYKSWKIELILMPNGFYLPYYTIIPKEQSRIVMKDVFKETEPIKMQEQPKQISLFDTEEVTLI